MNPALFWFMLFLGGVLYRAALKFRPLPRGRWEIMLTWGEVAEAAVVATLTMLLLGLAA